MIESFYHSPKKNLSMDEQFKPGDFICGKVYQITIIALSEKDSDDTSGVYDVLMCMANKSYCRVTQAYGSFLQNEKDSEELENQRRTISNG